MSCTRIKRVTIDQEATDSSGISTAVCTLYTQVLNIVSVDVVHAAVTLPKIGGSITFAFDRQPVPILGVAQPVTHIVFTADIPYGYYADSYTQLLDVVRDAICAVSQAYIGAVEFVYQNSDNLPHQFILGGTTAATYSNTANTPTVSIDNLALAQLIGWPQSVTIPATGSPTRILLPVFSSANWPRARPAVYLSVSQLPAENQVPGTMANDTALASVVAQVSLTQQCVNRLAHIEFGKNTMNKLSRLDVNLTDSSGAAYSAAHVLLVLDFTCE